MGDVSTVEFDEVVQEIRMYKTVTEARIKCDKACLLANGRVEGSFSSRVIPLDIQNIRRLVWSQISFGKALIRNSEWRGHSSFIVRDETFFKLEGVCLRFGHIPDSPF